MVIVVLQVHSDQLTHARKGCLTRLRQDIRTDGSRIEDSHKGWNSIQRAHPSGIVMFIACADDFVLRRNIRTINGTTQRNPFIAAANGSHHIRLANHIAYNFNAIIDIIQKASLKWPLPAPRPTVSLVITSEVFGIALSKSASTYVEEIKDVNAEASSLLEIFDEEWTSSDTVYTSIVSRRTLTDIETGTRFLKGAYSFAAVRFRLTHRTLEASFTGRWIYK